MVCCVALAIGQGIGIPLTNVSEGSYLFIHAYEYFEFSFFSADSLNLLKKMHGARDGEDDNDDNVADEFDVPDNADGVILKLSKRGSMRIHRSVLDASKRIKRPENRSPGV